MQRFTCDCGNVLFFGSSRCLKCGGEVGYDPAGGNMRRLQPGGDLKRCGNGLEYNVCNWLLPADSPTPLCVACRLNHTIPNLGLGRNRMLWGHMETAKRRLVYTLLRRGITLPPRTEDPQDGLAFEIVSSLVDPAITTGHLDGVITVNLEEADDTYRQINRQQLGENSRTLLGHFRHESAHYVWQRFLSRLDPGHPWRAAFREVFGDDRQDYGEALKRHYAEGPPSGWEEAYISSYASSHPWEDWAETWRHYLEILDGLDTCENLGIQVDLITLPPVALPEEAGTLPACLKAGTEGDGDADFLDWLRRWMTLSPVLNEVACSLGEPPLYPFVIPSGVARKLRLAHSFANAWGRTASANAESMT